MPSSCVAINCSVERSSGTLQQGISFHRFPKDPVRRLEWCTALRRQSLDHQLWSPSNNSVLCSRHFTSEMFDRTGQTVRLRDSATPSLFDFRKRKRKINEDVQEERKKKAVVQRKSVGRPRKRGGKGGGQEEKKMGGSSDSPAGLGDLVLAAELMEVVGSTVCEVQHAVRSRRAFQNDHASLAIPADPARLSGMVQELAKDQHRQEQSLTRLRRAMEAKDTQLQKKNKQWEWELHTQRVAAEAKVWALEEQVLRQRLELASLQEEVQRTREQLSSAETVISMGSQIRTQQNTQSTPYYTLVPPRHTPGPLSVPTLCRGPGKWLRFYTGIDSLARFQALLAFLQGADGADLAWNAPGDGEREEPGGEEVTREEEEEEEEEENPQESLNMEETKTPDSDPSPQPADSALFPDDGDSEEETAESVRRRLLGYGRGGAGTQHLLSPEDQLLLVLTRLRLGLLMQDLAFRFRVAESTVSRIWVHWMEVMQKRLQQIPVRCSQRYIDTFQPKYMLSLGDGRQLTVLECADLLCDASSRERQHAAGKPAGRLALSSSGASQSASQPYRFLSRGRGVALASADGYLGFCSSARLEEWEDWAANPAAPAPEPVSLPPHLLGEGGGNAPASPGSMAPWEVLSVKSLTDKIMTFRYLRAVHPYGSASLLDSAWEVCCYLACLLHQPMGLR